MTTNLSASPELPLQYSLKDVSISILHQPGQGLPKGYQVVIAGDGNSFYTYNNGPKQTLSVEKKTVLELVNDFYHSHFFELADTYTVKKQVLLKSDGSITTMAERLVDIASTRLCIQLADYQKCITVVNGQPASAASLISKIERVINFDVSNP